MLLSHADLVSAAPVTGYNFEVMKTHGYQPVISYVRYLMLMHQAKLIDYTTGKTILQR